MWSDTDKKYSGTRIIFTDTETSNWTWDPVARQYYWHRFFSHQPDLNFENPRVIEAMLNVMRYWLDLGVDGLRLDAVPYLCEREGTDCENLPETHGVLKIMRAVLDNEYRDKVFLAEANQWPEDVRQYFGDGDECHMAFHFPLMPRMFMAIAEEDRYPIIDIMRQTPEIPENCQWAIFLRNHDEMTLEMVTDRERDSMYRIYATEPRARINVGIRRRLAPLMENDRRRIELLTGLLMSMPGTPIVYYGDEIGMGDNIYLSDRDGVRTPMQWSIDRNGGFSRSDPARLFLPPIMDAVYGYQSVNVESQSRSPGSLINWMRKLVAVRQGYKSFGRGKLAFLQPRESESDRVHPIVRERSGALRGQSRARGATGRPRSLRVFRTRSGRDGGLELVPDDRERPVRHHVAGPRLLLVLALGIGASSGVGCGPARSLAGVDDARAAARSGDDVARRQSARAVRERRSARVSPEAALVLGEGHAPAERLARRYGTLRSAGSDVLLHDGARARRLFRSARDRRGRRRRRTLGHTDARDARAHPVRFAQRFLDRRLRERRLRTRTLQRGPRRRDARVRARRHVRRDPRPRPSESSTFRKISAFEGWTSNRATRPSSSTNASW